MSHGDALTENDSSKPQAGWSDEKAPATWQNPRCGSEKSRISCVKISGNFAATPPFETTELLRRNRPIIF
jgi:hypothetical protein